MSTPKARQSLRLAAIWLSFALLAALPCATRAEGSSSTPATPAAIKHDAHAFGEAVRRQSRQFGDEVAHGARQFGKSVQNWWEHMKSSAQRAGGAMREKLHSA